MAISDFGNVEAFQRDLERLMRQNEQRTEVQSPNWIERAFHGATRGRPSTGIMDELNDLKQPPIPDMSDSNLMQLVDECQKTVAGKDPSNATQTLNDLKELGFKTIANVIEGGIKTATKKKKVSEYGYIAITPEKIKNFLIRKAKEYNTKCGKPNAEIDWNQYGDEDMRATTIHRGEHKGIGYFIWSEVTPQGYLAVPPANILETFKEHKSREVFDYFTIATVKEIKDPLLLGRIEGDSTRYFIAQWDNDISLDDLI